MKIISAHIKNLRLHKDVKIDFDDRLTLIGGPNESGKSTIAEAIHKALFLKAKGDTADHRILCSTLYSGENPEVELVLEFENVCYTLTKRFAGAKGFTLLSSPGIQPLKDDAAYAELGRLMKASSGLSQKAYQDQWGHLWVWQGKSSADPRQYARNYRSDLINCMQKEGAAVIMQSDLDVRIVNIIQKKTSEIFTDDKRIRSSSELGLKEKLKKDKTVLFEDAKKNFEELIDAATELDTLLPKLSEADELIAEAKRQIAELEGKKQRLQRLQSTKENLERQLDEVKKRHQDMADQDAEIVNQMHELEQMTRNITPVNQRLEQLKSASGQTSKEIDECEKRLDALQGAFARKQKKLTYYNFVREIVGLENDINDLNGKITVINERESDLRLLLNELSSVADIDQQKLNKIRQIQNAISGTEAIIGSIATGVKLLRTDTAILIDDSPLQTEEAVIITDDTLIKVGTSTLLQVTPGGRSNLDERKRELNVFRHELDLLLSSYGVRDYAQAEQYKSQRDRLSTEIDKVQQGLKDLGSDRVKKEQSEKLDELNQFQVRTRNLRDELHISVEAERELAENIEQSIAQLEKEAKTDEENINTYVNRKSTLRTTRESEEKEIRANQNDYDKSRDTIDLIANRISFLKEKYGDDAARMLSIRATAAEIAGLETSLRDLKAEINALAPDTIEASVVRYRRVLEDQEENREIRKNRKVELEYKLKADGHEDPREKLYRYKNELTSVEQQCLIIERKANAINLLNGLFKTEQKQLSLTFTKPLAERIGAYLKFIFGENVTVSIKDTDGNFDGLVISREGFLKGQALEFSSLSGGTKEQVAVAMRLAMAEVLAIDNEGCLPVVLDDAFTNTDPERIKSLQNMLCYAAYQRGLQLIVLSCNPRDYDNLGAKTIELKNRQAAGLQTNPEIQENGT